MTCNRMAHSGEGSIREVVHAHVAGGGGRALQSRGLHHSRMQHHEQHECTAVVNSLASSLNTGASNASAASESVHGSTHSSRAAPQPDSAPATAHEVPDHQANGASSAEQPAARRSSGNRVAGGGSVLGDVGSSSSTHRWPKQPKKVIPWPTMVAAGAPLPPDPMTWQNAAVLVDKPLSWTSFDVCSKLRGALRIKKVWDHPWLATCRYCLLRTRFLALSLNAVDSDCSCCFPSAGWCHAMFIIDRVTSACLQVGHAGTLDPQASGLLIICIGKGCKKVSFKHLAPGLPHCTTRHMQPRHSRMLAALSFPACQRQEGEPQHLHTIWAA